MSWFDCFGRGPAAAALSVAVLLGSAVAPHAGAGQQDGRIVALAYDSGANSLLKAYTRAVYRSKDGGQSWQKIAIAYAEGGRVSGIAASPARAGVAYVVGTGLGVLRTDDGGKTWAGRNEGLPSRDVVAVAAHTTQPDTVYVVVSGHGVYRSQDAGKSWRLMDRNSQRGIRQLIHSNMEGSMQTGWLFAATPKGIRRTMDCFCLWQDAGKLGTEAYSASYDPTQPKHIYAATEKGTFRSTDGGESWVQFAFPGSKAVALVFARPGTLYALDDKGALFRSADDGNTWNQVNA